MTEIARRSGSLSNGRSLNTVRARITELERVTGLVLIERRTKGAIATEAALPIVAMSRAMDAAFRSSELGDH